MQPYFLPYIGYFQLIAAVDKFVLLDDVNYINRGWINRNRIAVGGESHWLTVPLNGAGQNRLIKEIEIVSDEAWKLKMRRTVQGEYASAPCFKEVFPLFEETLAKAQGNLSLFLHRSLRIILDYLGLGTPIEPTSAIYPKHGLKGQERILDICMKESASIYINPPGGRGLYDQSLFAARGVQLLFLDPNLEGLHLRHSGLDGPVLSILDVLMLNPPEAVAQSAGAFKLVPF